MSEHNNLNNEKSCIFCNGTGIAEYFDMNRMPEVGVGSFSLEYLWENFGEKCPCPNCKPIEYYQSKNKKSKDLNQ